MKAFLEKPKFFVWFICWLLLGFFLHKFARIHFNAVYFWCIAFFVLFPIFVLIDYIQSGEDCDGKKEKG